jgi:glycosyltransferase involved in cell wall biosynthesis
MRIHVWAPEFSQFGGGIGVFSRELAHSLRELGHDIQLFGKNDRAGRWHGFAISGAGNYPAPMRTGAFAATVLATCGRERPDRIISTHPNFGPIAHAAQRAFSTHVTLISHGIDIHESLSKLRIAALRAADTLVAVSSWTRNRLSAIPGIEASKVFILPNTVDEERFSVGRRSRSLERRYGLRSEERVVLTVARLDPSELHGLTKRDHSDVSPASGYKGCDRLIEALPAIQLECGPVHYVIVGKGADRGRLEAIARRLGVLNSVTFAGFVTDEELADHYRLADAFAMPSTSEGFGIVFLESMACGTPVLGGNLDGSVDALDCGNLGMLVDPNDVGGIAAGLISLLKRDGPPCWFDRKCLHSAVTKKFGYEAFRQNVKRMLEV